MCIWNMAADTFGFDDQYITNVVYENASVQRFLNTQKSMGVSACKGMGKTFLLKTKRLKMMNDSSYMFLPKNQLVDTPGPIVLNNSQIKFLSSYENWVALWAFCISAYVLSQDEFRSIVNEDESLRDIDASVIAIVLSRNDGVYHVLNKVLAKKTTAFLRKAIEATGLLFHTVQQINRQIALFVDKLEEPFNRGYYKIEGSTKANEGKYNSSIWAYAQLSFAEAVYTLYSGRHHVKIFYGIREEALTGAEVISTEFSKFGKEMMVSLVYTHEDLKKMFAKYVAAEQDEFLYEPSQKKENPCLALCGITDLQHRSGVSESLWAYIERHTLGRPRDIMEIGAALYDNIVAHSPDNVTDEKQRSRICRHWVNQISTRICKEYLHVLEPFMGFEDNIDFVQSIERFLTILPTNVFTKTSVKEYCHAGNGNKTTYSCPTCVLPHYFSTLYNIGLLGCIYRSNSEDGYKNRIKSLGDSVFNITQQTLPDAVLYYLHPGISNVVNELRERNMLSYFPGNIVINSTETFVNEEQVYRAEHHANALLGNRRDNRVFLTSTERDLKNVRIHIKELLESRGYEVVMFESPDFPYMPADMSGVAATHDHCIDVALSCKYLIYIFDGTFGGRYAGSRYKMYIDEEPIIKIKPSVSFVEYLVAKKHFKDVRVYVSSAVEVARGEYIENGSPEHYKSKAVDKVNVFEQLGYFNALGNGTWYNKYSSISDLDKYLRATFPEIVV